MPAGSGPVIRQYGKNQWRVYAVQKRLVGSLHLIGTIHAVRVLKPVTTVVYYAYTTRKKQLGARYTLKSAAELIVAYETAHKKRKN